MEKIQYLQQQRKIAKEELQRILLEKGQSLRDCKLKKKIFEDCYLKGWLDYENHPNTLHEFLNLSRELGQIINDCKTEEEKLSPSYMPIIKKIQKIDDAIKHLST